MQESGWIANNYNTHTLSQDVKASYEVWSVNEIDHEKYFSRKIIHKMW